MTKPDSNSNGSRYPVINYHSSLDHNQYIYINIFKTEIRLKVTQRSSIYVYGHSHDHNYIEEAHREFILNLLCIRSTPYIVFKAHNYILTGPSRFSDIENIVIF